MPNKNIPCRTCHERKSINQFSRNVFTESGLQPDCKDCMKEKTQQGKNAAKTKTATLPLVEVGGIIENRIEAAISDHIRKLQASKKRLKMGKVDIKFVNGKVQLTI